MYLSYFFLWCAVGDNAFLTAKYGQVNAIFWPSIKAAQVGIIIASLGQAMQCIVVAPRLLASIAVRPRPCRTPRASNRTRAARAARLRGQAATHTCEPCLLSSWRGQADNMLRIRLPRGIVLTLLPFSKLTAGEPRRALVFTYL
tara:strand:- start:46 stop:477 length:432 start_codon:yes stop_codon:yes gene_type:complete